MSSTSPPDLRWRDRESRWAPEHQLFRPSEFGVDIIPGDNEAKAFVELHHYSGSYPSARLWHRFPEADLWEHLRAMDMLFFE